MSRRKQGRPQQRKTIDSLDQENDLLVCGECQANFPLQDIVKFIRHKVHRCNKENCDITDGVDFSDDDISPDETSLSCIGSKQPSISAPITRKESMETRPSPRSSSDSQTETEVEESATPLEEKPPDKDELKERLPLQQKQVVDAESNTTLSEPSKFVCETCKMIFNSAWMLLQHAQKEHGMKIYTTFPPILNISTPSPRPSTEHRTPPSAGTPGSGHESPFPHPSPFPSFRLPLEGRPLHHGSPLHGSPLSPFNRPPGLDLPLDIINDPFRGLRPNLVGLPHGMPPSLEHSPHHHHTTPPHFGHPAFDRPRVPMSDIDFYSKRLQQLAHSTGPSICVGPGPGPGPSPGLPRPENNFSPTASNILTNMHEQKQQQHEQQHQQQQHQQRRESLSNHSPDALSRSQLSPNHSRPNKSCEFCGKCFRFQSNLIVHRRSHTGEKPFKCPVCPHACTQQSKLKRHMKTHRNKSPISGMFHGSNASNSDGSIHSSSSTPDSNMNPVGKLDESGYDMDDEEEEEEEEEEEDMDEEFEEEEEEELETMNEESRMRREHDLKKENLENDIPKSTSNQLSNHNTTESHNGDIDEHHRGLLNHSHSPSAFGSPNSRDRERTPSSSLLNEMMENSGLKSIQPFNDAFQQAIAENRSQHGSSKDSEDGEKEKLENGNLSPDLKRDHSPLRHALNNGPNIFFRNNLSQSPLDLHSKPGIKREPLPEQNIPNNFEAAMRYASWFHQTSTLRDLHPRFFPGFGLPRDIRDTNHNGLNLAATESALKPVTSLPRPGPSTPVSSPNGGPYARRDRRTDTCEYCGKVFKNCSNLTVHRRSHTGEKPYKCDLCSYACAQSSKLTRHMKTHGRLGKDVYRCKFCQMPFSVASTLEKHMRKCVDNCHARLMHEADADSNGTATSNL